VDPYAVLGVSPDASAEAVAAAYRRMAKRWHPDRSGAAEAQRQMAQINVAYDLLRAGLTARRPPPARATGHAPADSRPRAAAWLAPEVRRALGPELAAALRDGEAVTRVVPVSTWASPDAVLAVTDRRLLWLLSDAITGRVRALRFEDVAAVRHRLSWPRRRTAILEIDTASGRRLSFAELTPATAAQIARLVEERRAERGRRGRG
jgi:hypothetical protein